MQNYSIVPPDKIPIGIDVPLVEPKELYDLCKSMEIICAENDGIGLSAVQIGIGWKLYVVDYFQLGTFGFRHFANCSYEGIGEKVSSLEGCLSLKDSNGKLKSYLVPRYESVVVSGFELRYGQIEKIRFFAHKFVGFVHQHEVDHSSGILISHIGKEINA